MTEPFSCGIGGGGFMVIRTPNGQVTTIDSREGRPTGCSPTFFENGAALPFNEARWSGLPRGRARHRRGLGGAPSRYGTCRSARRCAPAIDVAREASWSTRPSSTRPRPNVD